MTATDDNNDDGGFHLDFQKSQKVHMHTDYEFKLNDKYNVSLDIEDVFMDGRPLSSSAFIHAAEVLSVLTPLSKLVSNVDEGHNERVAGTILLKWLRREFKTFNNFEKKLQE